MEIITIKRILALIAIIPRRFHIYISTWKHKAEQTNAPRKSHRKEQNKHSEENGRDKHDIAGFIFRDEE
jgi:hypothetical protein